MRLPELSYGRLDRLTPDTRAVDESATWQPDGSQIRRSRELSIASSGLASVPGYQIEEEIGRGGMGVVYKARQISLDRVVALKLMSGDYQAPDLPRFRQEAEAVAQIQHPNIVQVYDFGTHQGNAFLSLELVEGGTLADKLAHALPTTHEAAHIAETLARAVQVVHDKGVIHRDLKPSNVLLTAAGVPKIGDFGLAKRLALDDHRTLVGSVLGTPSYMSPEQAAGQAASAGPATDIHALGVILYEMLAGKPPFKGKSATDTMQRVMEEEPSPPRRLQRRVPRDLETICLKCLAKEPRRRYATAEDLADDLRRFQEGLPIQARPVGLVKRGVKWAKRRPMAVALLALGSLVAVLAVAIPLAASRHAWLESAEIDGVLASKNRYRTRKIIDPPLVTLSSQSDWPNPSYDHVTIRHSSIYMDLSHWVPVADLAHEAGRVEPAYYTRVITLRKKDRQSAGRSTVSFQFVTGGFEVDLHCPTHPYQVTGSQERVSFGGHPARVRRIDIDLTDDHHQEITVVIQGTIWNGFQESQSGTQWAAFLSPDFLVEGELAVKFPPGLKPRTSGTEPGQSAPGLRVFVRENVDQSRKEQLPLNSATFEDPPDKDWWVWRPEKPQANHVYSMQFTWRPMLRRKEGDACRKEDFAGCTAQ